MYTLTVHLDNKCKNKLSYRNYGYHNGVPIVPKMYVFSE